MFDRALKGLAFVSSYVYNIPNICPLPQPAWSKALELM